MGGEDRVGNDVLLQQDGILVQLHRQMAVRGKQEDGGREKDGGEGEL